VEKLSWISLTFVRQHVAAPVNQDVKEYLNYVCTSEGLEMCSEQHRGKTSAHAWGTKKDGEEFKCQIVNKNMAI
jgi:hypothetical protein